MPTQPTLGWHVLLFFFCHRSLKNQKPECLGFVAKMIRSLLSRSHVIIQHKASPHWSQWRPGLLCCSESHPHVFAATELRSDVSNTPEVAECKTASAVSGAKWGRVKCKKWIQLSVEERRRPRICVLQRFTGDWQRSWFGQARVEGDLLWTVFFESLISFSEHFLRAATTDTFWCNVFCFSFYIMANNSICQSCHEGRKNGHR